MASRAARDWLLAQVQIRRARGLKLSRRRPLPRHRQPVAIQAAYLGSLLKVMQPVFKAAESKAEAILERELPREDALEARLDEVALADLDVDVDDIDLDSVVRAARTAAVRTSTHSRDEQRRQFEAALGIDPLQAAEPWLLTRVERFTRENVELIRTVRKEYLEDVRSVVTEGIRSGRRHEQIKKDLQSRRGVTKSRAALIARDQVQKFHGSLNKERQEAAGVSEYIWRTSGDARVRDEHFDLNGKRFKWSDPPLSVRVAGGGLKPGHPGEAVGCRCSAEPVIESLTAMLAGADGGGGDSGGGDAGAVLPMVPPAGGGGGRGGGGDEPPEGESEKRSQFHPSDPPAGKAPQSWFMDGLSRSPGTIDETQTKLKKKERRTCELLAEQGNNVIALEPPKIGRAADILVNGVKTELKYNDTPAASTIKNEVSKSIKRGGQARQIVIDGRESGLPREEAELAARRLRNITRGRVDYIRVIGADDRGPYDLTFWDFE